MSKNPNFIDVFLISYISVQFLHDPQTKSLALRTKPLPNCRFNCSVSLCVLIFKLFPAFNSVYPERPSFSYRLLTKCTYFRIKKVRRFRKFCTNSLTFGKHSKVSIFFRSVLAFRSASTSNKANKFFVWLIYFLRDDWKISCFVLK